jgi:chromosome partitioning protein
VHGFAQLEPLCCRRGKIMVEVTIRTLTVVIAGRKGGAGKTTTALNLAGALAGREQRVLLVDLDPQASLTRLLLGTNAENLEGIGTRILAPQRGLTGLARTVLPGVDLFPGDRAVETAAMTLADNPTGPLRLRKLLAALHEYAVILLDTPPSLGFALNSAFLAADVAVLPTALAQQDLDALADTLALREELDELRAARILAIVPNAVRNDSHDLAGVVLLQQNYGTLVADPVPLAVAVKRAGNSRQSVVTYEPHSAAAQAYRGLAQVILTERERVT